MLLTDIVSFLAGIKGKNKEYIVKNKYKILFLSRFCKQVLHGLIINL